MPLEQHGVGLGLRALGLGYVERRPNRMGCRGHFGIVQVENVIERGAVYCICAQTT